MLRKSLIVPINSREHSVDAITPNHLVNPGLSAPSITIKKKYAEYAWELDDG